VDRFYEIDGKLYPSVTTVLSIIRKKNLEIWRGRVGNKAADKAMEDAAKLGTETHERCNTIVWFYQDTGVNFDSIEDNPIANAFNEWFMATVKEVICAEKPIWSLKHGYAGTTDLVAILKGDRTSPSVIDIKTGAIWLDHALQLAAYQGALLEHGIKTRRRIALHLDKKYPNRPASIKEFENTNDFNYFLCCLNLYKYFEEDSLNEREIIRITKAG